MKLIIQRVSEASVRVDGKVIGAIGQGFMVLVGIAPEDNEGVADRLLKKMTGLRIFEDENGKTNLSLSSVGGALLMVSQFTLYADVSHGNRPGFTGAAKPDHASALFDYMVRKAKETVPVVEQGEFGADMKVSLINDGPFTIILDSEELKQK